MKHLTCSLALILIVSFFLPTEKSEAAQGNTYEVNAPVLHVRDDPAKSATIVGVLHKGDKLSIFQEKYGWVQTYYAGEVAWVAKHHLIKTQSVSPQTASSYQPGYNMMTITAPSVNIRSGPGLNYPVIAGTRQGDSFHIIKKSGDWIQVTLTNGNRGWIASWLTSLHTTTENNSIEFVSVSNREQEMKSGSLAGYRIVLDAGHGGKDPGAIGLNGIYEKQLISHTAGKLATTLRTHGATVVETRTGDYYLSLDERIRISNISQTDAFISVHYNAFPVLDAQGMTTYYTGHSGRILAENVHSSIASAVPLRNRGIMQKNYKVLHNTNAPSILMELGFITNPYDMSVIQTADYQQKVVHAITNGLIQYFHN